MRNSQFAKIGQFVGTVQNMAIGHFGELANSVLQIPYLSTISISFRRVAYDAMQR
jgi:hypothetical protein